VIIKKKILQKYYETLGRSYAKLYTFKLYTTLYVSYDNAKFAASDYSGKSLSEAVIGRIL